MHLRGQLSGIALLLIALSLVSPIEAATPRQAKETELKQLRSRIDSLRGDLDKVRNRYDGMRIELRDSEQRISAFRKNIAQLDTQLQAQEGKLRGLERKQRRLETAIGEQQQHLARQVRAATRWGARSM